MRVRGDGRPYQLNLSMNRRYDVAWFDIYNYALFTRGGPYWQVAKVKCHCFLHVFFQKNNYQMVNTDIYVTF